jgi:hypothetical protein
MERYKKVKYYLNQDSEFVIENYNFAKPFANFFPGIAGKYGIPMWVFYVNRAQAISSFGTKDKDHSILEFFPANKAWQLVSLQGFRTFIKVISGNNLYFYEPFQNGFVNLNFRLTNKMRITSFGLKLEEDNLTLGLNINIEYFNIPNDSYAGLVRIVKLKNLSRKIKKIQLLDGLPQIVPFGTSNLFLKKLSRTIEAWMNIENLNKGVPFYKLDVDPTDRPEVIHIKGGNFYLSFFHDRAVSKIIKPITEVQNIFGQNSDFSCPLEFLSQKKFRFPPKEFVRSKMSCAFSLLNLKLHPQEEKTFYTVVGYMRNLETLNSSISKITNPDYILGKSKENIKIIEELQQDIHTESSSRLFDLYAKQTYLDNIIRGGYPIILKTKKEDSVFYLYSRKHGDLERDYNKFLLQPTYFSQGNGNYRDINQNRRCDTWFNPQIKDENIITFFNLLQLDGFNPLVIKGISFLLDDAGALKKELKDLLDESKLLRIVSFLNKPFTLGEIIIFLQDNKIKLKISYDEFLNIVLTHSIKQQEAEHGEGFWTDHWTYNLDLLENYLGVYPEKLKEIILEKKCFTYYDNTETVRPRSEKYLLYNGLPRQLHSVTSDNAKSQMIRKRTTQPHTVRTDYGKGDIYITNLINKLLCLVVNKLASLDPFGMGIEMEANKPNWYDALNGLPALFGSSICETMELKRLILFIKQALEISQVEKIYLTQEIYDFLINLDVLLQENLRHNSPEKDFQYWDKSYSLKEDFRQKTRFGVSGKERDLDTPKLISILNQALLKLDAGIARARHNSKNIYYAYFINEVIEYESLKTPYLKPTKFIQKKLPFFLEAQMHALRLSDSPAQAKALYKATKSSELYDKKLKMYKITASLKRMPEEIGRCRNFTPGWLENESIWLHMEYKYLLEILKQGLYKEFYEDFKNVLIPFQNPRIYGRSTLENSSFLVSSAFADKNLQGNGFVARLSGSTAEFLQIWLIMNLGQKPFSLNEEGELILRIQPILSGWLFNQKGLFSFNFLSTIRLTYHNPKRKNTFGKNSVKPKRIIFNDKDGNPVEILSDTIPSPYAQQIRLRLISQIDVYLE